MGHCQQLLAPALLEETFELLRRVALLGGVKSDGLDHVEVALTLLESLEAALLAQMPKEAHDEVGANSKFVCRLLLSLCEADHEDLERNSVLSVGLWIKEDFGVPHVVLFTFKKVGIHQREEVLLSFQHVAGGVIDVQEVLEA